MKKKILVTLAMAFAASVMAQDAPAPAQPGNGNPPQEGRGPGRNMNRPPRTNPEIMGILILGRDLLMEKYDADKDGRLSNEERAAVQADLEARKIEFLKKYDADGDGKLSPEEWKAVRDALIKGNAALEGKIDELIKVITPAPRAPRADRPEGAAGERQGRPEGQGERQRGPRADRPEGAAPEGQAGERQGRGPRPDGAGPAPRGPEAGNAPNRAGWQPSSLGVLGARGPHDPVIIATVGMIIDKYDADKNGVLSEEEFKKLTDDAKAAMEKRQEAIKAEMEKRHKEMLEKYDKDGDGTLSPEERAAMREDTRKPRNSDNNQ